MAISKVKGNEDTNKIGLTRKNKKKTESTEKICRGEAEPHTVLAWKEHVYDMNSYRSSTDFITFSHSDFCKQQDRKQKGAVYSITAGLLWVET